MINSRTAKILEQFAIKYLVISDLDLDRKKKILALADSSEFANKELLDKLLNYRECLDEAISAVIEIKPNEEINKFLIEMERFNIECQKFLN